MNVDENIKLDGMETNLAELGGLSFDNFEEKRGEAFPKGYYTWEVEGGEDAPVLKKIGEGEKAKAAVPWKMKCLEVISVDDKEFTGDPASLIGKYHMETSFITTADAIGYLKAYVKDIGGNPTSDLKSGLATCVGLRFNAYITKRKDKNDSDIVYTSINRNKGKIKPLDGAVGSAVAQQVG